MRLFISHASEDKKDFVEPLAEVLKRVYNVWYDKYVLRLGDSLLRKINEGLRPAGFQDRSHQPLDHPSEVFVLRSVPLTTRWASRAAGARIISSTLWPRLLAAAEFHRRIPRPTTAATKKPRQRVMFS